MKYMIPMAMTAAFLVAWYCFKPAPRASDSKGRERVELVTWRTRNPHAGCPSNGCWVVSGAPRMIEAYGINKAMWPHRCDGCAATNEIYDARWPRIEQEWRPVK